MKQYLIDLQMNTRDLGGYRTQTKKDTVMGRFIRSDVPQYLTAEGIEFFYQLGVTTVIDFRTDDIGIRYPSVFSKDPRFNYRRFPISEGSVSLPTKSEDSPYTYMKMLAHTDTFGAIFKTIVDAKGSVFYHCTAGKDRTGVVSFLLLDLVGVEEATMIQDYALSEVLINERIGLVREAHPDFPASLGFSKASYMERFIPLFRSTYGKSENYLQLIGLTPQEIELLKQKLLKP